MSVRHRFSYAIAGLLLAFVGIARSGEAPVSGAVSGTFEGPSRPVWEGEAFDLTLTWRVDLNVFRNLVGPLTWDPEPLVTEPWQQPSLDRVSLPSGQTLAAINFRTRAMALEPGTISLQSAQQAMSLQTGVVRSGDYERAVTETLSTQSEPATLEVRPLPPAPAGYLGAVGRFTFGSSVEPKQAKVGEAFTWTLTLAGTGNWPYLKGWPTRQVSSDFDVAGAPRVIEAPDATLFERTMREDVVLIPRRAGRYTLGPVAMIVFDPDRGQYRRLEAPAITLEVLPGNASAGAPAAFETEKTEAEVVEVETNTEAAPPDDAEEKLPALLDGSGSARRPMSAMSWRWALAASPAAVFSLWMLLALLRARQQDPDRVARQAHARLHRTLRKLSRTTDVTERRRLVRSWQHDVALRWKLDHAAPVPESFDGHDAWKQLWAEADVFLYGRSGVLPEDWTERARQSWADLGSPPPFRLMTMFASANLRPTVAMMLILACWGLPDVAPAQAAEETWRDALERNPLDWKARFNLAVTLAEQERWDEAAGHAGIAWVQQPAVEETRALWTRAAREAGYAPSGSGGIPLPSDWLGEAAGAASPATWRWIVIAFAGTGAVGAALLLLVSYGHASRRTRLPGIALLLVGVLGGSISWILLRTYGASAEQNAVVVWRQTPLRPLPIDTPADEVQHILPAGVMGNVDGGFLDWRRVRLDDGRAGWLRQENVIWIWSLPQ